MDNVFEFNGAPITFQQGNGNVLVNATEMARPFDKKAVDFTRLDQTQRFQSVLEAKVGIPTLLVNHGGSNPGTWMHQKLALKFAAWLNPEFELWVYDRIEELLKHGVTAMPSTIEQMLENPDVLINALTQLKEERAEKIRFQRTVELQERELKISAPKVEYYDEVLQSNSGIPINQIAKEIGMSAVTLNRALHAREVIYNQSGNWVLYHRYQNKGYTKTKTHIYYDNHGVKQTSLHTVWTELGREFIHGIMRDRIANQ